MGDWIKENKFEAGLLFFSIIALLGAYFVGSAQGRKYSDTKENYDAALSQKKNHESKRPYPTDENEEDYEEVVEQYRGVVENLQAKFLGFRPESFEQIAPAQFTEKLNAKREALASRYTGEGIAFPDEKWQLGFEKYTVSPPPNEATAFLSYQLDALDWLFGALADARPTALVNVYREELPVENGEPMDGGGDERGRPGRGRGDETEKKPFHLLPVELTFKAREPAARAFLEKVASNSEHFFVIRSVRVQNEKRDKAPQKDDVDFEAAPAGGAFDPTFPLIPPPGEEPEGDTPAPEGDTPPADPSDPTEDIPLFPVEPPADTPAPVPGGGDEGEGDRILGQILGAEEIFVFLDLELLLFKEKADTDLPEARAK